jgi:hypothetical protein
MLTILGWSLSETIRIVGQAAIGVFTLIGMAYVFLLRPRGPRYQ